MIYPEERETYINIDHFGKCFGITTNNTTIIKRLVAKGYYPQDGRKLTESEIDSLEYIELDFGLDDLKNFVNVGIFQAL
jgi:hypothetical protein